MEAQFVRFDPGGVESSAYCGPDGARVLEFFRPVREDYREGWQRP
jgi:hypothetical protein